MRNHQSLFRGFGRRYICSFRVHTLLFADGVRSGMVLYIEIVGIEISTRRKQKTYLYIFRFIIPSTCNYANGAWEEQICQQFDSASVMHRIWHLPVPQ